MSGIAWRDQDDRREDAGLYREIRLMALKAAPETFGSTCEDETKRPMAAFEERVRRATVFGAFLDGPLNGIGNAPVIG